MTVQCKLCGKDINPHDTSSWKEVTGFVGGPKKDSMVLRTDTGNFACTPCIYKAKEGQAPDQPSLFEQCNDEHCPMQDTVGQHAISQHPVEFPSREMLERYDEALAMLEERDDG